MILEVGTSYKKIFESFENVAAVLWRHLANDFEINVDGD